MSEAFFMDDVNTDPFTLSSPILPECEFLELLWKKCPVEKPLIGQVRVSCAPSAPQLGYEAGPLIEDDEMAFWLHYPTGDTTGTGICTRDIDIGTGAGTSISTGTYTRDTGIDTSINSDIYTWDTGIGTSISTDIYTCDTGIGTSTVTSTNTSIYTRDTGMGASAGTGMTSVGQLPFEAIVPCSEQGGNLRVARTKRKLKERTGSQANTECAELGASDKSSRRAHKAKVHNLCEQRRREKFNEKLKTLQDLIPRCNKTDKASILGDAIGYMKSLQKQVQMFSMGCNMRPLLFPSATPMGMNFGLGMNMNIGMGISPYGPAMPCAQFNRPVQHPIMPMQHQQHPMMPPMQQQQVQDMFIFPNVRNPFQFAFVLPGQVQAPPQGRNHEKTDKGKQAKCADLGSSGDGYTNKDVNMIDGDDLLDEEDLLDDGKFPRGRAQAGGRGDLGPATKDEA